MKKSSSDLSYKNAIESMASRQNQCEGRVSGPGDKLDAVEQVLTDTLKTTGCHRIRVQ